MIYWKREFTSAHGERKRGGKHDWVETRKIPLLIWHAKRHAKTKLSTQKLGCSKDPLRNFCMLYLSGYYSKLTAYKMHLEEKKKKKKGPD